MPHTPLLSHYAAPEEDRLQINIGVKPKEDSAEFPTCAAEACSSARMKGVTLPLQALTGDGACVQPNHMVTTARIHLPQSECGRQISSVCLLHTFTQESKYFQYSHKVCERGHLLPHVTC